MKVCHAGCEPWLTGAFLCSYSGKVLDKKNGLDKSSMNNNLKNIQNKLSEMNLFQKLLMKKTVILTNLIQIKILLLKTIVNMFLIQTQTNQK